MSTVHFTTEEVKAKCQENGWLKDGGYDFQDGLVVESDYPYGVKICDSIEELERKLGSSGWGIRTAFAYDRLLFVNQVNGGDEWWTCYKHEDGSIESFESISFYRIIEDGKFKGYMERLLKGPDSYWERNN